MFDVTTLDRLNFGDLGKMLDHVLEKMEQLTSECPDDEDDPRQDVLLVIANQIIERMHSIMRANVEGNSELLEQWNRVVETYKREFKKYVRTYLKDGVPLVMAEPEEKTQAAADAAWRSKIVAIVLDETLLEGMNAHDLFEVTSVITEKVRQLDEESPEEVAEPIIEKLLKFGDLVFKRLDPLVRETYKDDPEKLADWLAIVNDYKDLDDEGGEHVQADVEFAEVS